MTIRSEASLTALTPNAVTTGDRSAAAPFYVIFFDTKIRGRRSTGCFEIDADRMFYDNIVRDIADGQYEGIDRIYHCTPGGLCEDVTRDTAIEVERLLIDEEGSDYVNRSVAPWIEKHAGGLQTFDEAAE